MLIDHLRSLRRLALETEDEAWRMSRRPLARGTTAFVSETLRDAGNLGEAMLRIARGFNIVHGGRFNRVDQRPKSLVYSIDDEGFPFDPGLSPDAALSMMEAVLIYVHAMLSLVAGDEVSRCLRRVSIRRGPPLIGDGPLGFWSVPVRSGAASYQLEYSPDAAALPVRADFAGFGAVEVWAQAIRMVERRGSASLDGLVDRVRAAIVEGAEDQTEVARRLGVSVATLRRRLEECGHGFRELRAEVLHDRACRLLDGRGDSAEVAEALGFADGRSFARAFKSWSGMTPSRYQASVGPAR